MTSQGAGDPFVPGEVIEAFRACHLSGNVRIDLADEGELYPEKLTGIHPEDTAVFRYIKSETPWKKAALRVKGRGRIQVFLNELAVCTLEASDSPDKICEISSSIECPAGEYEVRLIFEEAEELEVFDLVLQ